MSVPAFIDVTEEEQAAELRSYLKNIGADISEENSDGGLAQDLQQIVEASDILWKEEKEAEIEAAFNSLLTLVFMVPQDRAEKLVATICERLCKISIGDKTGRLRVRLLQNLMFGLGESSSLCYHVYVSLVRLAGQTDSVHLIPTDIEKVQGLMGHWDMSMEKTQNLYRLLHDALLECKHSDAAMKVMLTLLGTYTDDNASQARDDAHRCIVASLKDPECLLLDHLLALKPVKFLEGELLHDLLVIFASKVLQDYLHFYNNNKDFISSLGLNHEANLRKMKILTFMSMAETRKEISFDTIQQEMMIADHQVEAFIIEVIGTKKVRARINQVQKKVIISYSMHRRFTKPQWMLLKDRLELWQRNLHLVRDNLASVATSAPSTM